MRDTELNLAYEIFKCNFMKEICILIKVSSKFVPKGPINNIPVLVKITTWPRSGGESLSESMMTKFPDAYMHHLASMG